MLIDTMTQWSTLKEIIENPNIETCRRGTCLDAFTLFAIKQCVDRTEVIDYFKSLFHRIFNGELEDELCAHLVTSCSNF